MNSLSWMIYLAGVSKNVATLLGICGSLAGFGAVLLLVFGYLEKDEAITRSGRKLLWPALISVSCASLIPSSNTIYAIAASEVGENVLTSPTANKAMQALNAWLDRQIAPDQEQPK